MPGETPNLHLSLGPDAAENLNWQKIDALLGAMAVATIIPGNLQVQGNLNVTGDADIAGTLTAGIADFGFLTVEQTATLKDLVVTDTTPSFIAGSIDPNALQKGASVRSVWVGTPGSG